MLVRDVTHETRDGGEASARALAAPVVAITERRETRAQEVAASGQTEQEQPRVIEQRQCVHAQRGRHAQGGQAEKALKPAQEPAEAGPHDTWDHLTEHVKTPEHRCGDVLQRGSRRLWYSRKSVHQVGPRVLV